MLTKLTVNILRITEGSLAPVSCLEDEENQCERVTACPTIRLWEGLYKVINDYVDNITLDDLVNKILKENSSYDFCI